MPISPSRSFIPDIESLLNSDRNVFSTLYNLILSGGYNALYPPERIKLYNVEKTFLSEFKRDSMSGIKLLDGLIGMCPMIGLLGTVYGMIEVFEVLSFLGTGNPRAMSSGVAKATIPTMASMVITLFGLYFRQDLTYRINKATEQMTLLIKQKGYSH